MATKKRATKQRTTKKKANADADCGEKCNDASCYMPYVECTAQINHPPIVVHVPDDIRLKVIAISDLSSAIKSLARALESTNCTVTIRDCQITAPHGSPGISVVHN